MNISYEADDTALFATDEYGGAKDDVNETEQFSAVIDLRKKRGITIDNDFEEIGGGSTDNLLVNIYRKSDSSFDGKDILVKTVDCGTAATEKRKSIVIDAEKSGYGYYRLGNTIDGTADDFDLLQVGRYWR